MAMGSSDSSAATSSEGSARRSVVFHRWLATPGVPEIEQPRARGERTKAGWRKRHQTTHWNCHDLLDDQIPVITYAAMMTRGRETWNGKKPTTSRS
jgi:hypothetical protein